MWMFNLNFFTKNIFLNNSEHVSRKLSQQVQPPPLEDDRSTKKTKFQQQGEDGDNPPTLSFRDKLLETQHGVGDGVAGRDEFVGREDHIEIENDDVIIKRDGIIPSIDFSH